MLKQVLFLSLLLCIFLLPPKIYAQTINNQFITIVNPVRISAYTKDPAESISAQYFEVKSRGLPASWLFTYDVLQNPKVAEIVKQMDLRQDLGIFLEVTPEFAKNSKVVYNKTDSWHRSNSIFLSGYTQEDRKKLIDTVFEKFKLNFGYFPKSVGAWWVDSFSLEYMKTKYGVTATLGCSDQFHTDGYSLWGQYWSIPFYPSKLHAGMPARNLQNKLDIVSFQWASRDPLNGYSGERASSFSTQDYFTRGLSEDYFEKLIGLYALKHNNQFGQITLGLEGDFPAENYKSLYASWMNIIVKLSKENNITVSNMQDFSLWYRKTFPDLSPAHLIETDDLLGSSTKVIWYQSPAYRMGLIYNKDNQEVKIIDWRVYQDNFEEPFYLVPNTQLNLYINTPSLIDTISDPETIWQIPSVPKFEENKIIFPPSVALPLRIERSTLLKINKTSATTEVEITEHWPYPEDGLTFRSLPPEIFYLLNSYNLSKSNNIKRLSAIFGVLIIAALIVFKSKLYRTKQFKIISIGILLTGLLIVGLKSQIYSVSQAETEALLYLKSLDDGKVVVFDETCLKCIWHNKFMPAALANNRGYVSQVSGKPIIHNRSIFVAKDRPTGKKILDSLKAKYIYIVKHENYTESLPFSPGDYNVELIYENANAQIWRLKDEKVS
ncbi:hypothetical protein HYS95_01185 [Candidatus Daviesbacteria bacterium]|nr:hypothetical protein [Candidatus Daviesbacteria bacterium]